LLAAIALDQWVKHLVETGLAFQEKIDLVPFLALYPHLQHRHCLLDVRPSATPAWWCSVSSSLSCSSRDACAAPDASRIGFALIVGGALGNLIDRRLRPRHRLRIVPHAGLVLAIFNLADALFFGWRRADRLRRPSAGGARSRKARRLKD
jgi:signal peptidase II